MKMDRRIPRSLDEMSDLSSLVVQPTVVSKSVLVDGRRVSLRLEQAIWDGLKEIGQLQGKSLQSLCGEIHASRTDGIPFATSIRVFVLNHFRNGVGSAPALVA